MADDRQGSRYLCPQPPPALSAAPPDHPRTEHSFSPLEPNNLVDASDGPTAPLSKVQEHLRGLGAEPMADLEQLEEQVKVGEDKLRELQEAADEQLRVEEGALADDVEKNGFVVEPDPLVIDPSSSETSDGEIERMLHPALTKDPRPAAVDENKAASQVLRSMPDAMNEDSGSDNEEDDEDEVDGEPIELDEVLEEDMEVDGALAEEEQLVSPGEQDLAELAEDSSSVPSTSRLLAEFWRDISRLYPPRYWLSQDPSPSTSTPFDGAALLRPISCTLTLRLPDSSTRTFSVPYSAGHTTRKAVRNAAANLVLADRDLLDEVQSQRKELGPEDEKKELETQNEGKEWWETVDQPYEEVLRKKATQFMAPGEVSWDFETDELNATHGCTLRVPITSTETRAFTVPPIYPTRREAKDTTARQALKDDVPGLWETAYKERLITDSGGYIAFSAKENGGKEQEKGRKADRAVADEVNPILLLGREVKKAFGGGEKWLTWAHQAQAPTNDSASGQPVLSASLTISFPRTPSHPTPPPPLIYAVPARFVTKHHALTACALAALKDGLVEKLERYRKERDAEREKVRLEKDRLKAEQKEREKEPLPRAGTVKWEDLDTLARPIDYLNVCAQQWAGKGAPLKFEYSVAEVPGTTGKRYKHHGCSLSVYISPTLTKIYSVAPSSATLNPRAAKIAATRLALRERVLDLLMPPGFEPSAPPPVTRSALKKQAKTEARAKRAGLPPSAACPHSAPPGSPMYPYPSSSSTADQTAVDYLDKFAREWMGSSFVPAYDVRQNEHGLYGAVLNLPLPPPHPPKTFWVDFAYLDRSSAQKAVAAFAVRDGAVEQIMKEVSNSEFPPAPARATSFGGGRGTGPLNGAKKPEVNGGTKRIEPLRKSSSVDQAASSSSPEEPPQKKQRLDESVQPGVQVMALDVAIDGEDEEEEEEGPAKELLDGVREKLGSKETIRPSYSFFLKDNSYGASITVPLPLSSGIPDSRTFTVPSTFSSKSLARSAAAQAALSAGVLELIESRSRVPVLSNNSVKKESKGRGKDSRRKEQVTRTTEQQEEVRKAAYGGFGGGLPVKSVQPVGGTTAGLAATSTSASTSTIDFNSATVKPPKGKMVLALEAHCISNNLRLPVFTRTLPSASDPKERVFVVINDDRFELPKVPPKDAEERLAAKVLAYLKKKMEGEKAGR
ncbi:hypothetical protein JCM8547_005694 [Rhodosporidiobolus lusitaniae]